MSRIAPSTETIAHLRYRVLARQNGGRPVRVLLFSESAARRSQVFSRICARGDVSLAAHHYMSWPVPRYELSCRIRRRPRCDPKSNRLRAGERVLIPDTWPAVPEIAT